ncbi:succinate--CoA ligase subunit alpha [Faunimonas sp. B44]|uniref:succinate--CoA ligase subunit alpha n=1 Tax=Faunimonas sp. B44 TaxID=3461493 RepID=UPI004043A475
MTILIDRNTRVVVQGITGRQARLDTENSIRYGTQVVAGVTPGRGGEEVLGVPVYNTVRAAVKAQGANASMLYVPAQAVRDAVFEAIDAGIRLIVGTSEGVSRQGAAEIVAAARAADVTLVGLNTNGLISPGQSKVGGIGGVDPADIYVPGRIGICSRSGGMTAEFALTLKQNGYGVSTAIAMGGDRITGRRMVDYLRMFEADPGTDAVCVYGEPGSRNEAEVAEHLRQNGLTKPVVAVIAGRFQENYPKGMSFGHAAAMISSDEDSASAKQRMLAAAGVRIAQSLADIPGLLAEAGIARSRGADGEAGSAVHEASGARSAFGGLRSGVA